MKIYSWNVNSLRACEESFIKFLREYDPDVVLIQELRAHPDQISFFLKFIDGYECFFNDSGRPGYAGTAVYYKSDLGVKNVSSEISEPILEEEGRVIKIELDDFDIYNFYTPNGNSSDERLKFKLEYYGNILKLAQSLRKEDREVILAGDLNVAADQRDVYIKNPRHSGYLPEEREWFENVINAGFLDSFRMFEDNAEFYSWWHYRDPERTDNNGWRFDYILVPESMSSRVKGAGISKEVFGSDHCPVWVEILDQSRIDGSR